MVFAAVSDSHIYHKHVVAYCNIQAVSTDTFQRIVIHTKNKNQINQYLDTTYVKSMLIIDKKIQVVKCKKWYCIQDGFLRIMKQNQTMIL